MGRHLLGRVEFSLNGTKSFIENDFHVCVIFMGLRYFSLFNLCPVLWVKDVVFNFISFPDNEARRFLFSGIVPGRIHKRELSGAKVIENRVRTEISTSPNGSADD